MNGSGEKPSARATRILWHGCADEKAWIAAAVDAMRSILLLELGAHARVRLLLSGGTTPAPIYCALAEQALDWTRMVVTLVDDRDVDPDAEGSNARLIRTTLLRDRAADARFLPLLHAGQGLDDAVRASNAAWPRARDEAAEAIALAVLGMGDDGHTASLFPGAANLDAAFASSEPYAAIDATGCPVAGAWPHRISLTPAGLVQAHRRMLLIRGDEKRATFERALAPGDARAMPIRAAIDMAGSPLEVYWCP